MKLTCLLACSLFITVVNSASISLQHKPFDIPVKVVYSDEEYNSSPQIISKNVELLDVEQNLDHSSLNDNLSEKLQLSPSDVLQQEKHLPVSNSDDSILNLKANTNKDEQVVQAQSVEPSENEKPSTGEPLAKPEEPLAKPEEPLAKPEEPVAKPEEPVAKPEEPLAKPEEFVSEIPDGVTLSTTTTEEYLPDPNYVLLIQLAQSIVFSGLHSIKENVNKYVDAETLQPPISNQQWSSLNQTITDFFTYLIQRDVKRNYNDVLREIVVGVDNVTGSFVNNLRVSINSHLRQEPSANSNNNNMINYLENEFKTLKNNLKDADVQTGTTNTVLGQPLEGTVVAPPSNQTVFQVFVTQIGQLLSNLNPFQQGVTVAPIPQGDHLVPEPVTPSPPGPFENFQNAANQFSQAIAALNPFNQGNNAALNTQSPLANLQSAALRLSEAIENVNRFNIESATFGTVGKQNAAPNQNDVTENPLQNFQHAVNQFGQAVLNLNPFLQRPTAAPNTSADEVTTPSPLQSFQQAANQLGSSIFSLNPFIRPPNVTAYSQNTSISPEQAIQDAASQLITPQPPIQADTPAPFNPLQGFQNAVNNFGQVIGNLNPFNRPLNGSGQADEATPNPVQGIQDAANQVGQAVGNLNPFNQPVTPSPGSQGDAPPNPFQGIQNAVNNFGQAVGNLNPFNRPPTPAGQADQGAAPNPVEGIQNAVNQVGQVVGSFNPFNQPVTAPPGSQADDVTPYNPIQGLQNAVNTFGQTVNSINPFNRPPTSNFQNEGAANPEQGSENAVSPDGQAVTPQPGVQADTVAQFNPIQGLQNVVSTFGQAVNSINPFNRPPGNGSEANLGANPVQGIQNAVNQVGQAVGSLNPFNQPSPSQLSSGTLENNPANNPIQNAVSTLGQAVGSLNPFNRPPNAGAAGGEANPLQGAINQVGHAVASLNPFNQIKPPSQADVQGEEDSNPPNPAGDAVNPPSSVEGEPQRNKTRTPPAPIQVLQNAANRITEAVQSINPFSHGRSPDVELQSAESPDLADPLNRVVVAGATNKTPISEQIPEVNESEVQ